LGKPLYKTGRAADKAARPVLWFSLPAGASRAEHGGRACRRRENGLDYLSDCLTPALVLSAILWFGSTNRQNLGFIWHFRKKYFWNPNIKPCILHLLSL